MCGIVGAVSASGNSLVDRVAAQRMCDAIVHRGPDSVGIRFDDGVFLGMRRLAIIDLAGGEQPIFSENRRVCAVVNGEIYNYRSLREELECSGHRFASASDVECVVHAYEEYGTEAFAKLRGMFAIALWDEDRQRLLLVRDRFGKKPLFYWRHGDSIVFASELKSLLAVPAFNARLNRSAVGDYLALGYVPTPGSMLEGVRKLQPGHYLEFCRGVSREQSYWQLQFTPKLSASETELTEQLDSELHDAVAVRLNSDVPYGAFLSGGIDSSLVVALMTRHMSRPVETFSVGFAEAAFNEADDAALVSRHIGTNHHELVLDGNVGDLLATLPWHLDEPLADSSAIPTFLVSQLAARHVKMVLSGDGGDEMFAGYGRYARYLQLRRLRRLGAAPVIGAIGPAARLLPAGLRRRLKWAQTRLSMRHPDDYIAGVALATGPGTQRLLSRHAASVRPYAGIARHFETAKEPLGVLDRVLAGDILSYLLDDILVKVDRMSMANSLEVRSPLLDQQLAGFAARLPEALKLRGGTGKYLLRRVAARYLPEHCIRKPKQGFAIPLAQWLRSDLKSVMLDTVHSRAFAERDLFDVHAIRRMASAHVRGVGNYAEVLWAILVLELWATRFVDAGHRRQSVSEFLAAGQAV